VTLDTVEISNISISESTPGILIEDNCPACQSKVSIKGSQINSISSEGSGAALSSKSSALQLDIEDTAFAKCFSG